MLTTPAVSCKVSGYAGADQRVSSQQDLGGQKVRLGVQEERRQVYQRWLMIGDVLVLDNQR
jgi:hypothetical protein